MAAITARSSAVPTARAETTPKAATPDPHLAASHGPSQTHSAGVGEAVARVAGHERPQVVGVHGDVRVAAGGLEDLLEQPRGDVWRGRRERQDREPERQAHQVTVTTAAIPVVTIRTACPVSRSHASGGPGGRRHVRSTSRAASSTSSGGNSARRIVTTATIGMRIPSCGLMRAAMTVKIAARSGRSRHSSRRPRRRKTTPNESTWPQSTLSNQVTGFMTVTKAADEREAIAAAELADHRPGQPADGEVGEDGGRLEVQFGQEGQRRGRRRPGVPAHASPRRPISQRT